MKTVYTIVEKYRKDNWDELHGGIIYRTYETAYNRAVEEAYDIFGRDFIIEEHPEWLAVDIIEKNGKPYASLSVKGLIFIDD